MMEFPLTLQIQTYLPQTLSWYHDVIILAALCLNNLSLNTQSGALLEINLQASEENFQPTNCSFMTLHSTEDVNYVRGVTVF